MTPRVTKGKCTYCNKIFSKSGMWKHLETCKERKKILEKKKGEKCFHILVDCGKIYWLHIGIPVTAKLKDLDNFLRDIWLECCGHLSAFRLGKNSYVSYPDDYTGYKDMEIKLSDLLTPGMVFTHEYDFGSTTELKLKVLSEYKGEVKGKSVKVMARNDPPEMICYQCDKKIAAVICSSCGPICEGCSKEHACGILLPVVNSPRTGICGYGG
ncbi:MAG TPA: hypothetical protein PL110_10660 [Candidatus Eremiobacteraeota bacterium]|nr:MAG: hypothetical protein BWY64_01362 [bacterium ADurb.Bin363]HPZ08564.1 hypothetical protein [Candidatus Eremiobacteraeota bacterium]